MKIIDDKILDELTAQAQQSERLRMNLNLHDSLESPSQRLLNALEPGTQLVIHRHMHTSESYIVLRGRLKVIYYSDKKEVEEAIVLDPLQGNYGVHIPRGQWHTIEVLEHGTAIFEAKDGPYTPLTPEHMIP